MNTARMFANMLPYCMKLQCGTGREVPTQPIQGIAVKRTCRSCPMSETKVKDIKSQIAAEL
jgi:hypothetical protein